MDKEKLKAAENALKKTALQEGKTVNQIVSEIKRALLVGICSNDPNVQEYWKRIPCEGDIPTPEEVIVFISDELRKALDL